MRGRISQGLRGRDVAVCRGVLFVEGISVRKGWGVPWWVRGGGLTLGRGV